MLRNIVRNFEKKLSKNLKNRIFEKFYFHSENFEEYYLKKLAWILCRNFKKKKTGTLENVLFREGFGFLGQV